MMNIYKIITRILLFWFETAWRRFFFLSFWNHVFLNCPWFHPTRTEPAHREKFMKPYPGIRYPCVTFVFPPCLSFRCGFLGCLR
jgi:hypothetical protein